MSNRSKWIWGGLALATISAALTVAAFQVPPAYHYEEKVDIIAQQRMVFVFIGELKRWPHWTKWAARNPEMKHEYSDPSWGVGATHNWKSFWSGSAKVTQFTRDIHMAYEVTVAGYEPSYWQFKLGPAPRQGTTVVWIANGQYPENRFERLIEYVMLWRLQGDIRKGLERLKKHAELHEAYDVKGAWE